jgi:hypothetical protein
MLKKFIFILCHINAIVNNMNNIFLHFLRKFLSIATQTQLATNILQVTKIKKIKKSLFVALATNNDLNVSPTFCHFVVPKARSALPER